MNLKNLNKFRKDPIPIRDADEPVTKDTFIEIALESEDVESFLTKVRMIQGVPQEVAKWFSETYNKDGDLSIKQASQVFLNEVKYITDGEDDITFEVSQHNSEDVDFELLVGEDSIVMAQTVTLNEEGSSYKFLDNMDTREDQRNKGYASKLLKYVEEYFKNKGEDALYLIPADEKDAFYSSFEDLVKFYTNRGYEWMSGMNIMYKKL